MVRNKKFYQLSKDLCKAALLSLDSYLERWEEPVYTCVEEAEFRDDGGIGIESRLVPYWDILVANHSNSLMALPEFANLRNFVAGSELAKELLVDGGGANLTPQEFDRWLYQFTFIPLIRDYLSKTHSLDFNEEVFNDLYEDLEQYCYSPTIRVFNIAPLFHFEMQPDAIDVSGDSSLIIRRLTGQERSRLWRMASDSASLSRRDMHNLRFAAEMAKEVVKQKPFFDPKESFITLEVLLRLITRQPVAIDFVLQHREPSRHGIPLIPSYYTWRKTREQRLMHIIRRFFTLKHIELLQRLWQGNIAIGNNTRFTLALHRFGSAFDEANLEDKLIDLWIGLEALFSVGIKQELSYRISLRIAYFLGKTAEAREKIFNRLRESYKCRGSIVHSGQSRGSLDVITQRTENYLAASLKSCLLSRTVPSAKYLEAKITNGDSHREAQRPQRSCLPQDEQS